MARSSIEWTHASWNPVTGCTRISPGCAHCYAERMALRLQAMEIGNGVTDGKYARGFEVALHPDVLDRPLKWRRPQRIFVNSMSDLFHDEVPLDFILQVFATMRAADQHLYQILTKRSRRLRELSARLPWAPQIWMGVSVESAAYTRRIDDLRDCGAAVKFLSLEPLLGGLPALDLAGIDWVIAGGESGPGARPMDPEWVRGIQRQCERAGVAFFFKQWGGMRRRKAGRELDGRTWDQLPLFAP